MRLLSVLVRTNKTVLAMAAIDWKYYIVYCCIIAVELVVAYFTYPETKGRSLEQVAEVFGDEIVHVTANSGVAIGRAKNEVDEA